MYINLYDLDMTTKEIKKVSGIVLCAGESKRFGKNFNKLLYNYKGKPLVIHLLENLIKSNLSEIIIVTGFESNKVKQVIEQLDFKNKKTL